MIKQFAFLIVLVLLSDCKKSSPPPPATTHTTSTTATIGVNQFTFSNGRVNNINIQRPANCIFTPNSITSMFGTNLSINYSNDTFPSLTIQTRLLGIGIDSFGLVGDENKIWLSLDSTYKCSYYNTWSFYPRNITYQNYAYPTKNSILRITRFDNVGGLVEGNFDFKLYDYTGAFIQSPTDTLTMTGQFSVKRLQ